MVFCVGAISILGKKRFRVDYMCVLVFSTRFWMSVCELEYTCFEESACDLLRHFISEMVRFKAIQSLLRILARKRERAN